MKGHVFGLEVYAIMICSTQYSGHTDVQNFFQHIPRNYELERTVCTVTLFTLLKGQCRFVDALQVTLFTPPKLYLFVAPNKNSKHEMMIAIYE
jgi:hypothetical protein